MTTGFSVLTTDVVRNVLNDVYVTNHNVDDRGFWDAVRDKLRPYGIILTQGTPKRNKQGLFVVSFRRLNLSHAITWQVPGWR